MNVAVLALLCVCLIAHVSAFMPARLSAGSRIAVRAGSSGLKMATKQKAAVEEKTYWEGDWVCADCGYIYDADIDDPQGLGRPFEEMKRGFICPQCSAPRKRYAKAVNGVWGVTNDGGDFPMYALTFAGLAVTTWFSLVVVPTL